MVEFGLKLEDNKVDKWSSHYIDYEKLKAILACAKTRAGHRDELLQRMPSATVAEVLQHRKDHCASSSLVNVPAGRGSLPSTDNAKVNVNITEPSKSSLEVEATEEHSFHSLPMAAEATDTTPLLADPIKHANSWNNLHKAVVKVSSYFGLADDRALLIQACDAADDQFNLFRQSYDHEVSVLPHLRQRLIVHFLMKTSIPVDEKGGPFLCGEDQ